jgi:hypothetical protein
LGEEADARVAVRGDDEVAAPVRAADPAPGLNLAHALVRREWHPVARDGGVEDHVRPRELARHAGKRVHALCEGV